jgi:hypothetical protein
MKRRRVAGERRIGIAADFRGGRAAAYDAAMIPPRTILTAVDFSDASRVALIFAARLAAHCGAALHLLHAEEPLLLAAA